jgi:hypothetical protein
MVHLSPDEQIALTKSATWKKEMAGQTPGHFDL